MESVLAMLVLYAGSSFLIWMVFRLVSGAIDKVRLKSSIATWEPCLASAKGSLTACW